MNCRTARRVMDDPAAAPDAALTRHLAGCDACRRLNAALAETRGALRSRHAGVVPDAGFAVRVRARLRHEPAELLGLAALRMLPVTLIILLLLSWLAFTATPQVETGIGDAPTDDVLAWVLEGGEDGS